MSNPKSIIRNPTHEYTEAATQKCSSKTLFSNYATNLQGNTHVEV